MKDILEKYRKGIVTAEQAEELLRLETFAAIDCACIDYNRERRTGIPEVILAEGKTDEYLLAIVTEALAKKESVVVTRLDPERLPHIEASGHDVEWHRDSRLCIVSRDGHRPEKTGGRVGIITAGTSDIPVAEEAMITAEQCGCETVCAYDVGVAGIHRLFPALERMTTERVHVYIVAAGREGTLPALVSGLVDAPVIGLPVSTGYGAGGKGEAALFSMLQACSPLAVVNIDAGFVAGAVAAQIANAVAGAKKV